MSLPLLWADRIPLMDQLLLIALGCLKMVLAKRSDVQVEACSKHTGDKVNVPSVVSSGPSVSVILLGTKVLCLPDVVRPVTIIWMMEYI